MSEQLGPQVVPIVYAVIVVGGHALTIQEPALQHTSKIQRRALLSMERTLRQPARFMGY